MNYKALYEQQLQENKELKEENKNVIRVLNLVRKDKEQLEDKVKKLTVENKNSDEYDYESELETS